MGYQVLSARSVPGTWYLLKEGVVMVEIRVDDLSGPEVAQLIGEHLQGMQQLSPPESIHALDLGGLKKPDITFWSLWENEELLGIGALKELDCGHGEVKSMRTSTAHLRKGVARRMLQHIIEEARRRGYRRLSLETGSAEEFDPARRMYAGFGFEFCGPFADYVEDPNSVFMTMDLY
jgi:putative acetyltransferase